MIRRIGENIEREGNGKITYLFENGEAGKPSNTSPFSRSTANISQDAANIVENVVSIMEKLHDYQTTPPTTARSTQSSPRLPQMQSSQLLTPPQSPPRKLSTFQRHRSRVLDWASPQPVRTPPEDLSTIDEASSGEYLMAPAPDPRAAPLHWSIRGGDISADPQHYYLQASAPRSAYTESIYSARSATRKRTLQNMEESGARAPLPALGRMF